MGFAQALVWMMTAYAACGILFAVPFVVVGIGRVDAEARGASAGFRLLVVPGVAALWPLLLRRWLTGGAR